MEYYCYTDSSLKIAFIGQQLKFDKYEINRLSLLRMCSIYQQGLRALGLLQCTLFTLINLIPEVAGCPLVFILH